MRKEKKKSLSLKRTLSNNFFALKTIWSVSPIYLTVYLAGGLVYGVISFLYESYMLRMIVNGATNGESIKSIMIKVALIGIGAIVWYGIMQWFWNVISPKYTRKIAASVEKEHALEHRRRHRAVHGAIAHYIKRRFRHETRLHS